MLAPTQMLQKIAIGNDAGWALTFHQEDGSGAVSEEAALTLSSSDYYASIEASLPDGFGPGKYTFGIEGITDAHYAAIRGGKGQPTVVRLHLFWRDANASVSGYLANLIGGAGLFGAPSGEALAGARVAELAITKVSRKVGARRYEAEIEARERAFMKLHDRPILETLRAGNIAAAVKRLCGDVGVSFETHGFSPDGSLPAGTGAAPGDDSVSFDHGITYAKAMADIGKAVESIVGKHGRGMLLIRDGKLHVGPRPIPPSDAPAHELAHDNGFVDSESQGSQPEPAAEDASPGETTARARYKLILKGRPDIRPGDVASFHPALEDGPTTPAGALGAVAGSFLGPLVGEPAAGPEITLYVNSVEHRLSRDSGFVTTLSGVEIRDGSAFTDAWDEHAATGPGSAPGGSGNRGGTAGAAASAARAIRTIAEDAAAGARLPEVGEVRAAHTSGTTEPPSQTLTVWRGLDTPDGRGNQARRLPIRRHNPSVFDGVAYASPFAWGKCGLVLPRYPGTRTLLVQRNGQPRDPVDVGALWESGHGPDSEAGDWWLILPVDVPQADRGGAADSETPPEEHAGQVTNDLIDAEGRRTIEVGELTIRVGKDALGSAGTRPAAPSDQDAITIEHTKEGAKITLKPDGTISIEAGKDIELAAPDGDIKMNARSVKVTVDQSMEVS
jgi:hypothetical protein